MRWSIKLENGRWHVNCMRRIALIFIWLHNMSQNDTTLHTNPFRWWNMVSNEMQLNGINTTRQRHVQILWVRFYSIREYRLFDNILNCVWTTKLHSKEIFFWKHVTLLHTQPHIYTTHTHAQPKCFVCDCSILLWVHTYSATSR